MRNMQVESLADLVKFAQRCAFSRNARLGLFPKSMPEKPNGNVCPSV